MEEFERGKGGLNSVWGFEVTEVTEEGGGLWVEMMRGVTEVGGLVEFDWETLNVGWEAFMVWKTDVLLWLGEELKGKGVFEGATVVLEVTDKLFCDVGEVNGSIVIFER